MTYEIGKVIKDKRKSKKISVEKLANLTGLAASYIYQIESGSKNPTFQTLKLVSDALQTEISLMILKSLKDDNISKELLRIYEESSVE